MLNGQIKIGSVGISKFSPIDGLAEVLPFRDAEPRSEDPNLF